jgi:glycosyltransferase involved in cell wall biosynthesis
MSSGIPVIASRFPLWREVVEGNACGLCVDPHSPQEIAEAIDYLARNPAQARRMGENGRQAVLGKYNWKVEESKLMRFYDSLF